MLHQYLIEKLSAEIKIAPLNIIREYLEMEVLYQLNFSPLAENLVFYGGTALRLAHHGFRFSEDIDFLLLKQHRSNKQELEKVLIEVVKINQGVKIEEIFDKRLTLFGLLHIKHNSLKHPIRLKIEMSKKSNGVQTENVLLSSPTSNKEAIFRTATLEAIYRLKKETIKNRETARDWFDFWYLSQRLHKEDKINKKFPFQKMKFTNELKRWLPRDKWKIIETAIKSYQ